jgi:uncharacterized protein YfaQ (DUF2300 family)
VDREVKLSSLVLGGALALSAACADAGAPAPQLWWVSADGVHREVQGAPAVLVAPVPAADALAAAGEVRQRVPLGSTWKLFAYAWLQTHGAHEPAYACTSARPAADDEYCCEAGGQVGRDAALAQSCGPYFSAQRLHVDPVEWRRFWHERHAPEWVGTPAAFDPATEVDVVSLLAALGDIPAPARQAARDALLPLSLKIDGVVPALGAGPRFKTWSWTMDGERAGGAAGWLADGTPFWFGAPGTSRTALRAHAAWIGRRWAAAGLRDVAAEPVAVAAESCVSVALFNRYPIASVTRPDGRPAQAGTLTGPHRVTFASGNVLAIDASPGLQLLSGAGALRLEARWSLEDYVARVVDREGDATQPAAARALAVAARSYLVQNAGVEEGCRRIADDSRTQRASPSAPSRAARDAAAYTRGLVLDGPSVHYHGTQAAVGQMSWAGAVEAARAGASFDAILHTAYPQSRLVPLDAADDCVALPEARDWLLARQRRWRESLAREAGFEPLPETLQVCRLAMGVPHSDQRLLQIRVREWFTQDGRVTLVHEYLHLAFRHHPRGRDDDFVERLARHLVES